MMDLAWNLGCMNLYVCNSEELYKFCRLIPHLYVLLPGAFMGFNGLDPSGCLLGWDDGFIGLFALVGELLKESTLILILSNIFWMPEDYNNKMEQR